MKFIYLIGAPGAGKTTTMKWIRFHLSVVPRPVSSPFAHSEWMKDGECKAIEYGANRGVFSGTDALSMSVIEKAIPFTEFLAMTGRGPIFAEGDRLANLRFFNAVRQAGYTLKLFYLDVTEEIAAERRETRRKVYGGDAQDVTWVKSRASKARALAEDQKAIVIPTYHPADIIAADIIKEIG